MHYDRSFLAVERQYTAAFLACSGNAVATYTGWLAHRGKMNQKDRQSRYNNDGIAEEDFR
jgi:hypothetical protein